MDAAKIRKLVAAVRRDESRRATEGLDPLRDALDSDSTGRTRQLIEREAQKLSGRVRGSVMFLLAGDALQAGDLAAVRSWFDSDDSIVRESVMNGIWSCPNADAETRAAILELALQGMDDEAPGVRAQACSVVLNLSGYRVDVTAAIEPLLKRLKDPEWRVRHQAAATLGRVAKKKHDVSRHIAQLSKNLKHREVYLREMSAKALGNLCGVKHDIGPALPNLAEMLTDPEDYEIPRQYAARALLRYAKMSEENALQVAEAVDALPIERTRKELRGLLDYLAKAA